MTRIRRDIDDLDDSLFEAEAAKERREVNAHRRDTADRRQAMLEAQDAAIRESARRHTLENNRRQVLSEYASAGAAPPCVDGDGTPTCSLSLLLKMGWTFEYEMDGAKYLAPPRRAAK